MSPRRIKPERKLIGKIENPSELAETLKERIEKHKSKLITLAVVFLLIVAGVFGFDTYNASRERRAEADYAGIVKRWPEGEDASPKALEPVAVELEKHIEEFGTVISSRNAKLDLAKACFELERYEDALKWGKEVLNESGRDRSMMLLARYQVALTLEAVGKSDEALSYWTALRTEGDRSLTREVEWHLGKGATRRGDYGKAVEHYENALRAEGTYPDEPLLRGDLALVKSRIVASGESIESGVGANPQ